MRLFYIILILFISISPAFPNAKSILISHDNSIYNPLKFAVKEITFNIEIEGLAKEISDLNSYGKIEKVLFEVNVDKLRRINVKVFGIPNGFTELIENLKAKLVPYLELLFPQSLSNFYRSYELKSNGNRVSAVDQSYLKPIRESYMLFEKNGILLENKIKTAQGTQIINFEHGHGSNGLKELVLEKVNRKIIYGPSHLLSATEIKYDNDSRIPFPKEIYTVFTFENKENNSTGKRVNKLNEKYIITNFKLN